MSTRINKFASAKQQALANAHMAALRPTILDNAQVRAVMQTFPAHLRRAVSISVSDYSHTISFNLYMRDLSSLKDKKLMRVLEAYTNDEWLAASSDYTYDLPNRDFTFRKTLTIPMPAKSVHTKWLQKHDRASDIDPTMRVEIVVFISAYVKADSASCRIEVVERKEKIVIEEVKQIVCG